MYRNEEMMVGKLGMITHNSCWITTLVLYTFTNAMMKGTTFLLLYLLNGMCIYIEKEKGKTWLAG